MTQSLSTVTSWHSTTAGIWSSLSDMYVKNGRKIRSETTAGHGTRSNTATSSTIARRMAPTCVLSLTIYVLRQTCSRDHTKMTRGAPKEVGTMNKMPRIGAAANRKR